MSQAATASEPVFHVGRGQFPSKAVDQSWFAEPIPQHEHPRWSTPDEGEALLARDGYLVIPALYEGEELDRLYQFAVHGGKPDEAYEVKGWCFNKMLSLDLQRDPTWLWTLDKERAIEQLDRLLGSDCTISNPYLWVTGPGRRMPYHVDVRALYLPPDAALPPGIEMPCMAAVMIVSLDDQVMEQGPTVVVPGSHLRAPGPLSAPLQPRAVLLKRGDAVILRTDVCHGAAPNTGPRRRYHLHCNWGCSRWARHDAPMRFRDRWDPRVVAAATARQRRILGDWTHRHGEREQNWRVEMGLEARPEYA